MVVGAAGLLDRAPRTVYRASSRWASTWTAASRTSQWASNHTPPRKLLQPDLQAGLLPQGLQVDHCQLDLPMNVLL